MLSTYVGLFAAFAWNVLIVYLTLGFRHYSHYFTSIQIALSAGDEHAAPPGVLAHHAQEVIRGDPVHDLRPGAAVVGGPVDVGPEVVAAVAVLVVNLSIASTNASPASTTL